MRLQSLEIGPERVQDSRAEIEVGLDGEFKRKADRSWDGYDYFPRDRN